MADIKFEIVKKIATINDKSVWHKELNLISWNDKEPKYDIRDWDPEHQKMSKGITLTKDEMINLKLALENLDLVDDKNIAVNQSNGATNSDNLYKDANNSSESNVNGENNINSNIGSSIEDIFADN